MPKNIKKEDMSKCFDEKMIKAFAKAHKWKRMLDEEEVNSLAGIAPQQKM